MKNKIMNMIKALHLASTIFLTWLCVALWSNYHVLASQIGSQKSTSVVFCENETECQLAEIFLTNYRKVKKDQNENFQP